MAGLPIDVMTDVCDQVAAWQAAFLSESTLDRYRRACAWTMSEVAKGACADVTAAVDTAFQDPTRWDVTKPGTPNEAIDCLVYAYAALCLRKARSRRIRDASAIKLETRRAAPSAAAPAVTLNASRPASDPVETGGRALAGVRRVSGDRHRPAAPPPASLEAAAGGRWNSWGDEMHS